MGHVCYWFGNAGSLCFRQEIQTRGLEIHAIPGQAGENSQWWFGERRAKVLGIRRLTCSVSGFPSSSIESLRGPRRPLGPWQTRKGGRPAWDHGAQGPLVRHKTYAFRPGCLLTPNGLATACWKILQPTHSRPEHSPLSISVVVADVLVACTLPPKPPLLLSLRKKESATPGGAGLA